MATNAEIAISTLMNGKPINYNGEKYMLSEDFVVCKLVQQDNMPKLEEADMSLSSFIKMTFEMPREALILGNLPN